MTGLPDWLTHFPEQDPPELAAVLPGATIPIGTRTHIGIEWRLDAVLTVAHFGRNRTDPWCVPGVVVRPVVFHNLDHDALAAHFTKWASGIIDDRPSAPHVVARGLELPDVRSLTIGGPLERRAEPIKAETQEYWANRALVIAQAERLRSRDDLDALLWDYPWVIASLPYPKRLWYPDRPLRAPSRRGSADRVLLQPIRPGRPRSVGLPELALEIYWALPNASTYRGERWQRLLATWDGVPPKLWWALAVAEGRGFQDSPGFLRRARQLKDRADARRKAMTRGRTGTPGRADVRLVVPYLWPDLATRPLRLPPLELREAMLRKWVDSAGLDRALLILSRRDLDSLQPDNGPGGDAARRRIQAMIHLDSLRQTHGKPSGPGHQAVVQHVRALVRQLAAAR